MLILFSFNLRITDGNFFCHVFSNVSILCAFELLNRIVYITYFIHNVFARYCLPS